MNEGSDGAQHAEQHAGPPSKRARISKAATPSQPVTPAQRHLRTSHQPAATSHTTPECGNTSSHVQSGASAVARTLWPETGTSSSRSQQTQPAVPLVVMLLDVEEGRQGAFHLYARTMQSETVLIRVSDFEPYWFIPSPQPLQDNGQSQQGVHFAWPADRLQRLRSLFNMRLPPDLHIKSITEHHNLHPIMYFRPGQLTGSSYLQLRLAPGSSATRAAAQVHAMCKEGMMDAHGFAFPLRQDYEAEVKPITRFLCDRSLSGGAWLFLPAGSLAHVPPQQRVSHCMLEVTAPCSALQCLTRDATQLADPNWQPQALGEVHHKQTTGQAALPPHIMFALDASQHGAILPLRVLTLDVLLAPCDCTARVAVPSKDDPVIAIACELFTAKFGETSTQAQQAGGQAASSEPAQQAGSSRTASIEQDGDLGDDEDAIVLDADEGEGEGEGEAGGGGAMLLRQQPAGTGPTQSKVTANHTTDATEKVVFLLAGPAHSSKNGAAAHHHPPPATPVRGMATQQQMPAAGGLQPACELTVEGACVILCGSESELLLKWQQWLLAKDPDAIATFQVRDTLGALAVRAATIKVDAAYQSPATPPPTTLPVASPVAPHTPGASPWPTQATSTAPRGAEPGLYLSRQLMRFSSPVGIKSVVQYSPQWVKSQSRMASTSNQETFKVLNMSGRLTFDVLRQVLTHQSLATFTLVDCVQSILHRTLEVLAPQHLAQLWALVRGATAATAQATAAGGNGHATGARGRKKGTPAAHAAAQPESGTPQAQPLATSAESAAARLAQYCFQRTAAIRQLMSVLATVPETFEMARVTGLSLAEVQYKAQMVRTWSLLLRNARRHGYLVGGRQEVGQLIESPYLMHPLEHHTAGLYTTPVACLDFASLYPSLYRAHNLCYTTLVVSEDVESVGRDQLTFTPSGHAFVQPHLRQGILPTILASLMTARSKTRETLKALPPASSSPAAAAARAVLDSRQKALKLTANALYGFTGAQASPLQCVPLADSCLALGAQACRTAIQAVGELHAKGAFGQAGRGAKVIYGQTDSLFIHFPHATAAQAINLGKQAAKLVTEGWCKPPMQLQFERVCCPFLLLHVNRYAGKSFETEDQAASGNATGLLVKGVRSMWRQSAPFVQRVLQGALQRIIMQGDVASAVAYAEEEIRRLLSGRVEVWELIMTGGLWRITGQQVAAAAAGKDAPAPGRASAGSASTAATAAAAPASDDVKGPHASLAVRLAQRDPGRSFLLGERVQYVLLAGVKLQDEASEDPLLAAELGMSPNLELYWRNKLQTPLTEIFEKVLSPNQMQVLLSGPHTMVRVEQLGARVGPAANNPETAAAAVAVAGVGAAPGPVDVRRAETPAKGAAGKGGKQSGLSSFFKQTAKCLYCKQPLPQGSSSDDGGLAPALCSACAAVQGRSAELLCTVLRDQAAQQRLLTATASQCVKCHSGGMLGQVACSNAECNVLYDRLGAARRLAALEVRLQRISIGPHDDW